MPRSFPASTIHLPATDRHQTFTKPRTKVAAHGQATESTILLVDDDLGVLASLARVLRSEGWQVVTATNGAEALERLAAHQPDLMITDLNMGEVSGWDLLFHENLQRPSLPIFVITALPPSVVGGADRFATAFFQKPLDLDVLLQAIRCQLGLAAPTLTS